MLENYFGLDYTTEQKQRLLAVQAALEVAISSAGASTASANADKVENDLKYAAEKIHYLANAIQAALKK